MSSADAHIIKLGGSLLDLPDLLTRLAHFRETHAGPRALLVVGGGDAADAVRAFDRAHGLDEEQGHWLAVRAMQLNAHLLAAKLPAARLVTDATQCAEAWLRGELALMDPLPWLEHEAAAGIHIPHRWAFTSDSIAAHVAHQLRASRLTLLKSTLPNGYETTLVSAAQAGLVDAAFPGAAKGLPCVEVVDLRSNGALRRCALREDA